MLATTTHTSTGRWGAPLANVTCQLPDPINHLGARAIFDQVRKENPALSPATQRRESARRLGVDYDTYLAAWKKPEVTATPRPGAGSPPYKSSAGMPVLKASPGATEELLYNLEIAEGRDQGYQIDAKGKIVVHDHQKTIRAFENAADILDDKAQFGDRGAAAKARAIRALITRLRATVG